MKSDPSLILNRSDFIFPYFFGSSWIRPFVMYAPLLSLITCSLRQTTSSWWIIYVFKELTHMKCKIGQLLPRKNKQIWFFIFFTPAFAPLGAQWVIRVLSVGYQWVIRGLSEGYQRAIRGFSEGYQRVVRGLSETV